jgi:hypothetical protein
MKNYQLLIEKLGIALCGAFLLTQMGCHLPGPPGLPGLPRPPGLPHGELRNPVRTAVAVPTDEVPGRNDTAQPVQNQTSENELKNIKTAGLPD